ncbi:MAG: ferrous iron transport protein B [Synergistaceae bacterium]|jgi:ferrous iron transport protein B|nr:ferrous iron transport protein B [Synergistaceae bacterium]
MKFALAGNPNSGKTTLFNNLTGSSAHVGNWPGVTVDRKEGLYRSPSGPVTVVDLPGIYSLSPYSPEEIVARDYIVEQNPDLVINIVDATNLERNLYLTTQLMETDRPIVVALNMMDVIEKEGLAIDVDILEQELGLPVVPISALDASGLKELMRRGLEAAATPRRGRSVLESSPLAAPIHKVVNLLDERKIPHSLFHAIKLIEGDSLEKTEFRERYAADLVDRIDEMRTTIDLPANMERDFEAAIADLRYRHITGHYRRAMLRVRQPGGHTLSTSIDRFLTHKLLGIPIFLAVMFFVFHMIFSDNLFGTGIPSPGVWLQELTGTLMDWITGLVEQLLLNLSVSDWARSMAIDGLFAGVGAVLSFLPQIMMLFLFLSILEDSGYMARAAFLMDRILRCFGLSGKSFLPMLMGFGCSVPAMMATRTLEDERDRRITIMLMPCFSCGAKAPIWAMFATVLFPQHGDIMIFGVYFIGILTAIAAGILLRTFIFRKDSVPFIMELPDYHMPRATNVAHELWNKLRSFLIRASTIIAGATVVIWFLSNFSPSLNMVEAHGTESILGLLGTFLQPLFIPLGFAEGPDGWKAVVAILTGLIAKEMVVSTMGVLYAAEDIGDAESGMISTALSATLAATFSPLVALSFMAFNLLSVPCMAAVATAAGEMKSRRWMWFTILFWIGMAWVVSFLIFRVGTLLGY